MGAVRGTPVLFWFLGFRCWVIGDRKREEYSRWKGNGNNQGGKEWTHGVFFGVRLAVRIAGVFFPRVLSHMLESLRARC